MTEPQNTNPSNQSDTSSEDQQPSSPQPSNDSTPEENELIFTTEDMVRGQFSRLPTDDDDDVKRFMLPRKN